MKLEHEIEKVGGATNSPPQNTGKRCLRSLVDWVSVTFKNVKEVHKIIDLFCLSDVDFEETTGRNGYASCKKFNHISFYYNGTLDKGVNVELTGQGCREYEQLDLLNWVDLFKKCLLTGGSFARLDVAIDDIVSGEEKLYFKISTLERKLKDGLVKSKMKRARNMEDIEISTGKVLGRTLYFGKADVQVRFYEKDHERRAKGYDLQEEITGWNRTEVQLRHSRADKVAGEIASESRILGDIIKGLLKHYITFITKNDKDSNKSRHNTAPFWRKFLGDIEPLKISEVAPDKTIDQTKSWMKHAWKKTMAKVVIADMGKMEFIEELIKEGNDELDKKEFNAIRMYWDNKEKHEKHFNDIKEQQQKKELPDWLQKARDRAKNKLKN